MRDKGGLHLKLQEFCDCYATTDYLKEMSTVDSESDMEQGALKWLALAVLHGINSGAEKLSLERKEDGRMHATAKYKKTELPSPGPEVGEKVLNVVRQISHIEGEKGKLPLALGIGDSSIEVLVKVKEEEGEQKVTIKFPE